MLGRGTPVCEERLLPALGLERRPGLGVGIVDGVPRIELVNIGFGPRARQSQL
jgi:hypothetical protein